MTKMNTRTLSQDKVPRPPFAYTEFHKWLNDTNLPTPTHPATPTPTHPATPKPTPPAQKSYFAIEIGCGVGFHPISWAKHNPASKILAIERTKDKFDKFSSRLERHSNLTNIYAAHADASHLLPHLDIPGRVDEYFVLYPNPYPKKKHTNLRFAYSPITRFMIESLKVGGRITFATNISNYADELRNEISKHPQMTLVSDTLVNSSLKQQNLDQTYIHYDIRTYSQPVPYPRTHFEKKYLERNEICHNLIYIKTP
ncbi:MAG: hypothetical protein KDD38_08105 [Bdellovibrionales bacterium]|nr:hypothetical protein [Bdellovibrionales bacterium]